MNGTQIKEVLKLHGWKISKIAELLGESRQNVNNMLSKDDIRSGLLEQIAKVTEIPIAEFYGLKPETSTSIIDSSVVNNGRDQNTTDPGLVSVIQEQQVQMARLISVIENLTNKMQ